MVGFDFGYMKQWGHFVVGGIVGFYGTHTETSQDFTDFQENTIIEAPAPEATWLAPSAKPEKLQRTLISYPSGG